MLLNIYKEKYGEFFGSDELSAQIGEASAMIASHRRIFFIGNGGSNSICSHMMEDFAKVLKYESFAFSDPALITCFSNDYGYDNAIVEWLKVYYKPDDLLVAVSSSGNSPNIVKAAEYVNSVNRNLITLTGFKPDNRLRGLGRINFYLNASSYGIVECFHQTILHIILDTINEKR
jgi:D-sedoheptulose 7-phosphate isomerase